MVTGLRHSLGGGGSTPTPIKIRVATKPSQVIGCCLRSRRASIENYAGSQENEYEQLMLQRKEIANLKDLSRLFQIVSSSQDTAFFLYKEIV